MIHILAFYIHYTSKPDMNLENAKFGTVTVGIKLFLPFSVNKIKDLYQTAYHPYGVGFFVNYILGHLH